MQGSGHSAHAERARALLPDIRAAAVEIERQGQVPAALMGRIHDARLMRMLLPRSVGGDETDLVSFVETIEEIAKADASTAWCVGQGSGVSFASAFLAPEVAREIFGPPDAVMASGPSTASAKAVAVEGGFTVSGSWTFASGSRNAQWLAAHCPVLEADGSPRKPEAGPQQITAIFPKDKARITNVWQVMGLAGTGSDDYSVSELFVPKDFTFTRDHVPDRRESGTLYRFSNFNIFGLAFAGIACGLARQMLDDFVALAQVKRPNHAGAPLAANAAVQQQTGFNEARLQAARTYLYSTLTSTWDRVARNGGMSAEERIMLRMMTAYVIQSAKDVVDFAYHAAGSTAIFCDKPFERRFRDMHVVTQQGQSHMSNFEAAGQAIFAREVGG